jgi:hypothetical protein
LEINRWGAQGPERSAKAERPKAASAQSNFRSNKAPGDAAALKGWLQQISQHVAEAAKESGFIGIGGVPVSDAEKATLTEISSALKIAA